MSLGVSETVSSLAKMRSRRVLLLAGIVATVAWGSITDLLAAQVSLPRALWQMVSAVTVLAVAVRSRRNPVRWRWLCSCLIALVVSFGPLSTPPSATFDVPVAFAPIILGLLFFERLEIVVAAVVPGVIATIVWWWGRPFLVENAVTISVAAATVLLTCLWVGSLRREEHTRNLELRVTEARRAQIEQLVLVGRLAAGVAHEINNPLAFVKANLGSIASEVGAAPGSELREILDETQEGVDRIRQIVADLRSFARDGGESIDHVELKEVVDASVRIAAVLHPRGLSVTTDLPRGLTIRANRRKLAKAVLNLLMNAGDSLERGRVKRPCVTIRCQETPAGVRVTIDDNGPGLSKEARARLFEPFFTTKPDGTGLGLVLAREYLTSFGATLTADELPSAGARFTITLPPVPITGEHLTPSRAEAATPQQLLHA